MHEPPVGGMGTLSASVGMEMGMGIEWLITPIPLTGQTRSAAVASAPACRPTLRLTVAEGRPSWRRSGL